MAKIHCYVCGKDFSFYGWANHVRSEKRKFGEDIYIKLRKRRQNKLTQPYESIPKSVIPGLPYNKTLLEEY